MQNPSSLAGLSVSPVGPRIFTRTPHLPQCHREGISRLGRKLPHGHHSPQLPFPRTGNLGASQIVILLLRYVPYSPPTYDWKDRAWDGWKSCRPDPRLILISTKALDFFIKITSLEDIAMNVIALIIVTRVRSIPYTRQTRCVWFTSV